MSKASCFLDSYAWLVSQHGYNMGAIRDLIRGSVYELAPDFEHDVHGYHPHLVNAAALAVGLPALAPVDACPCDGSGKPICKVGLIDESSVVVGLNKQGNEHAVACKVSATSMVGPIFYDPATREVHQDDCPLDGVRTQWVIQW